MKRVLVTGATGFTARYVIPLLVEAGFEVWRVSRAGGPGARDIAADITDPRAIADAVVRVHPTHLVHLAGTPNLPDSQRELIFRVNVGGTENLLRACAALSSRPQRVLLASSAYVYGNTGSEPADENRDPAPENEYGRSKLEMEKSAERWTKRLPIVVTRPFNYTGVGHGERFVVPRIVRAFRKRTPRIDFLDLRVVRDFSDVRWIAQAYVALLQGTIADRAVNLCSGRGTSLAELVRLLSGITGWSPSVSSAAGAPASSIAALVGDPSRLLRCAGPMTSRGLGETLEWMFLHSAKSEDSEG